jgi:hypothetical protein
LVALAPEETPIPGKDLNLAVLIRLGNDMNFVTSQSADRLRTVTTADFIDFQNPKLFHTISNEK